MGRLGSEIPKCYQFLLGLRSLRERWCCFPKKLVNMVPYVNPPWWINIQIPTNHTIARVDWTRPNHDLYESHLFYVAAHPSHEMRCKKKQEASSSCKWNDRNLKPQQLNAIISNYNHNFDIYHFSNACFDLSSWTRQSLEELTFKTLGYKNVLMMYCFWSFGGLLQTNFYLS